MDLFKAADQEHPEDIDLDLLLRCLYVARSAPCVFASDKVMHLEGTGSAGATSCECGPVASYRIIELLLYAFISHDDLFYSL